MSMTESRINLAGLSQSPFPEIKLYFDESNLTKLKANNQIKPYWFV